MDWLRVTGELDCAQSYAHPETLWPFDARLVIALLIRCIHLSFCHLSMVPAMTKIISLRRCECRVLKEKIRLLGRTGR